MEESRLKELIKRQLEECHNLKILKIIYNILKDSI